MVNNKKSFNATLDDLLSEIVLPSENDLREQTRREKISRTTTGRQKTEDFCNKLSISKKGKKQSEQHRINNAKSKTGKKLSDETRIKLSQSLKGKTVSDETRSKISKANKGKKLPSNSEELRIKKSQAQKQSYANGKIPGMLGKTLSENSRAKISKAHKGKKLSDETRSKISENKKGKSYGGNFKPLITPYGLFASITEAGRYEEEMFGKKYNPNRFTKLLKNPNSGYKRITEEEFCNLKNS